MAYQGPSPSTQQGSSCKYLACNNWVSMTTKQQHNSPAHVEKASKGASSHSNASLLGLPALFPKILWPLFSSLSSSTITGNYQNICLHSALLSLLLFPCLLTFCLLGFLILSWTHRAPAHTAIWIVLLPSPTYLAYPGSNAVPYVNSCKSSQESESPRSILPQRLGCTSHLLAVPGQFLLQWLRFQRIWVTSYLSVVVPSVAVIKHSDQKQLGK